MKKQLSSKLIACINDPATLKVLASIDKNGIPHAVFKTNISVNADGDIQLLEILETSQTNKNLVHSIWFGIKVAIGILTEDTKSYQIVGIPKRAVISGALFEKNYIAIQNSLGKDVDLSTVWIIEPKEIREETFRLRNAQERKAYPLVRHLDHF